MSEHPIYHVIEFVGHGDVAFGGRADDRGLYTQEDGSHAFLSAMDARCRGLAHSYFPAEYEALAAAQDATLRNGLLSVLDQRIDPRIPQQEIRLFVQNLHVETDDAEVSEEVKARLARAADGDAEVLAQAAAYALACHRANQALVTTFRL